MSLVSSPQEPSARPSATVREHVIVRVRCAHCHGAVELECEGLQGFWGYQTYNEWFCPHCRKQNHARTSGAVVSARVPIDGDATPSRKT
jgi:phage FluMu protein Com